MGIEVEFNSNKDEIEKEFEERIETILEAIGQEAEGDAKDEITQMVYNAKESDDYVRTGFLRNSITHAVSGKPPSIKEFKADKGDKKGTYSGTAPKDGKGTMSVYIGTGVKYGVLVHEGTSKMAARRFLKDAITKNKEKYKEIAERLLKGS